MTQLGLPSVLVPLLGALALDTPTTTPSTDGPVDPELVPPHIVVILADDLGWADLGTGLSSLGYASTLIQTPAIGRLAEEGASFSNAYVNNPTCAPARAALLTGQYPPRPTNGIYQVKSLNRGGADTLLVGPDQGLPLPGQPDERVAEIPGEAITVAETLAKTGYRCGHFGKYHVGGRIEGNDPLEQGFEHSVSRGSQGGPAEGYHAVFLNDAWRFRLGELLDAYAAPYTQEYVDERVRPYSHGVDEAQLDALVGTPKHVTDALTDATIEWIDAHKAEPLYVQLHHWAVHVPIDSDQARTDLLAKYEALPATDDDGDGQDSPTYAAMVEGMDQSVARLIDYLETTADPQRPGRNLAGNTVVFVVSDNGGKERQTNNGPLRGQKGELTEGGVRVPLIAWGPERFVAPGIVNPTPVSGIDLYPTFAELAGSATEGLVLDGESLAPLLRDPAAGLERQAIYWHLPGYLREIGRDQRPQTAIRQGDYKLYYGYEDARWELYDLAKDLGEANDLANALPEVRDELACEMVRWLVDVEAPLPTFRDTTVYVDGVTYEAGSSVPLPGTVTGLTTSYCTSGPTSVGAGARIGSTGTPSLEANEMTLVATGTIPFGEGLFFYGPNQVQLPFGDGYLCVAGSITRLTPAVDADSTGTIVRPLDFGSPPLGSGTGAVLAGSTHHFQLLFRDPAGGPAGVNLTDGLRVTFCP